MNASSQNVTDTLGRSIFGEKAASHLSRADARRSGGRYYHGSQCQCGCVLRYTSSANCVRCHRQKQRKVYDKIRTGAKR